MDMFECGFAYPNRRTENARTLPKLRAFSALTPEFPPKPGRKVGPNFEQE